MNMEKQEQPKEVSSQAQVEKKSSPLTELAKMDVQCHLLIKDTDTGEVFVNQRG